MATSRKMRVLRRRRRRRIAKKVIIWVLIIIAVIFVFKGIRFLNDCFLDSSFLEKTSSKWENGFFDGAFGSSSLSDSVPDSVLEAAEKNPEMEDFAVGYEKGIKKAMDDDYGMKELKKEAKKDEVPLLLQWDKRWGYKQYGSSVLGVTGCGPTALSMVAIYLTHDGIYTPAYMADFALDNGFYVDGSGTQWAFMTEGAGMLGLSSKELALDESSMISALDNDHPIICIMGAGDFTDSGHYIVLSDYEDGEFVVCDPNSKERSEKTWSFDTLSYQIKNLWEFSNDML